MKIKSFWIMPPPPATESARSAPGSRRQAIPISPASKNVRASSSASRSTKFCFVCLLENRLLGTYFQIRIIGKKVEILKLDTCFIFAFVLLLFCFILNLFSSEKRFNVLLESILLWGNLKQRPANQSQSRKQMSQKAMIIRHRKRMIKNRSPGSAVILKKIRKKTQMVGCC